MQAVEKQTKEEGEGGKMKKCGHEEERGGEMFRFNCTW